MISGVLGWLSIFATLGINALGEEGNANNLTLTNLILKSIYIALPIYLLMYLNSSIVIKSRS